MKRNNQAQQKPAKKKRKNSSNGSPAGNNQQQQQHREQDKQYKCEQSVRYNLDFNNQDSPLVSWYDWNEWLHVKKYLFSDDVWCINQQNTHSDSVTREFKEKSLEMLGVWKNKFRIQTSTIVESSYLFLEALTIDKRIDSSHNNNNNNSTATTTCTTATTTTTLNIKSIKEQALSNAIVRFVNLFSKDSTKAQSSSLAIGSRHVDCPKLLVDIRNEISHRKFPSVEILENCAKQALKWMKVKYWDKQEEHILNFQKEWIQNSNQYILQFNQRKEMPQVEEAFDKKEKQRRKEKIDSATREIEKIQDKILQQTRGPCCSFIVQSFLLVVLVSPQCNTGKKKPDEIVNKLRPLIDFLDDSLDFISHLLKQIFIIVRDFEIYSNKYNVENHPMMVCGVQVTFDMIELCFSYFDTLLRILTRRRQQPTTCHVMMMIMDLNHQIEISKSELLNVLKTTIKKHQPSSSSGGGGVESGSDQLLSCQNCNNVNNVEYGIGSIDSVLSYHLLHIENIDSNII